MTEKEAIEEAIKLRDMFMPFVKTDEQQDLKFYRVLDRRYNAKQCAIIAQKRVITYCMREELTDQYAILKALEEL